MSLGWMCFFFFKSLYKSPNLEEAKYLCVFDKFWQLLGNHAIAQFKLKCGRC